MDKVRLGMGNPGTCRLTHEVVAVMESREKAPVWLGAKGPYVDMRQKSEEATEGKQEWRVMWTVGRTGKELARDPAKLEYRNPELLSPAAVPTPQ